MVALYVNLPQQMLLLIYVIECFWIVVLLGLFQVLRLKQNSGTDSRNSYVISLEMIGYFLRGEKCMLIICSLNSG